jgi:hypothetical protein
MELRSLSLTFLERFATYTKKELSKDEFIRTFDWRALCRIGIGGVLRWIGMGWNSRIPWVLRIIWIRIWGLLLWVWHLIRRWVLIWLLGPSSNLCWVLLRSCWGGKRPLSNLFFQLWTGLLI